MAFSVPSPKFRRVERSFVVKNFSSKMDHFKPGQFVKEDLQLGDESIEIYVMPNGYSEESKGWVELGLQNQGEEEVNVNWWRIILAGRTFTGNESKTIPACTGTIPGMYWSLLTQEECRASLKAGALLVRFEVELAAKVGGQENSLTVVKNVGEQDPIKDDKKIEGNSEGIVKGIDVDEEVQSQKANIVKEEVVLKYHEIVIDPRVCHLRCSACKTRPLRCKVFQCSAGHLVCPTCLPSLTTCPFCNTSLPQPPSRNLCAEQCIASIVDVN